MENVNNKFLPVYEYSLPVDNKVIDLPLFATMRTDEKQKTIILDKEKNQVINITNLLDSLPADFDLDIYFALVQVSLRYKRKMYANLFDKIKSLMFIPSSDNSSFISNYFTEEENYALLYKRNIKSLYEKVEYIRNALFNSKNIHRAPPYELSAYNIELLDSFVFNNPDFSELISLIKTKKISKKNLEQVDELLNLQGFKKLAQQNKIHEWINLLLSGKILKPQINDLLQDYDFQHSAEIIPSELYFTYYDISKCLDLTSGKTLNTEIYKSLMRMRDTKYELWNCAYDAVNGKIVDYLASSFISSIEITQRENAVEFKKAMEFSGVTKANTIVKVRLEPFFINNVIDSKGHIKFELGILNKISKPVAKRIYMYSDKNRWWLSEKEFNTDKKIRLSMETLANREFIRVKKPTSVPAQFKVVINSLQSLKDLNLISDYEVIKRSPLMKSEFILEFEYSRGSSVLVLESKAQQATPTIEEKSPDLFSNNNSFQLEPELVECFKSLSLNNSAIKSINEYYKKHGLEYVVQGYEYVKFMKPKDPVGYLLTCLSKETHKNFMAKKIEENKAKAEAKEAATAKRNKYLAIYKEFENSPEKVNAAVAAMGKCLMNNNYNTENQDLLNQSKIFKTRIFDRLTERDPDTLFLVYLIVEKEYTLADIEELSRLSKDKYNKTIFSFDRTLLGYIELFYKGKK